MCLLYPIGGKRQEASILGNLYKNFNYLNSIWCLSYYLIAYSLRQKILLYYVIVFNNNCNIDNNTKNNNNKSKSCKKN